MINSSITGFRFKKVERVFQSAYAIAILPLAIHPQLQIRHIQSGSKLKLFTSKIKMSRFVWHLIFFLQQIHFNLLCS
jgi:serine kinase of HPr protein (carbohydrate metabolism regulator)